MPHKWIVLFAHSDWLARRWIASTIHLRGNREEQNGFPFRFGYRGAHFIDKRGGCSKKYKTGNKVWFNRQLNCLSFPKSKFYGRERASRSEISTFIVCICCSIVRNKSLDRLIIQLVWYILEQLYPQCRWMWWIFTKPRSGEKRRGIYPQLSTSTSVNNC